MLPGPVIAAMVRPGDDVAAGRQRRDRGRLLDVPEIAVDQDLAADLDARRIEGLRADFGVRGQIVGFGPGDDEAATGQRRRHPVALIAAGAAVDEELIACRVVGGIEDLRHDRRFAGVAPRLAGVRPDRHEPARGKRHDRDVILATFGDRVDARFRAVAPVKLNHYASAQATYRRRKPA